MKLHSLSIKDKELLDNYLNLSEHELSVYAFENIYIWKGLFDIFWALIDGCLCVFFKDKIGCFMYIPAQGNAPSLEAVSKGFAVMDSFNKNKEISRIENIEERETAFYRQSGYKCSAKFPEYLCRRSDLTQLKGNRFKSKRACFNYFSKHYKFQYMPFSLDDAEGCLDLFKLWEEERMAANNDSLYQGMLEDSLVTLKTLFGSLSGLNIVGRVVKIQGEIKAFTFGFKLNSGAFCILYEVADLSVKGLAQFIFREFCRELRDCKYINIMDDSGLENLKKVKSSYHPVRLIPSYIAVRS